MSKSNLTQSSLPEVLPTQMVLPVAPTPLPQNPAAADSENSQSAAPVDAAGHPIEQNNQAVSVSAAASNVVQPVHTNTSQQSVSAQPTQIPLPPQAPVPNQVVVQFKPDAKPEEINAYVASVGGTVNHKIDALNTVVINLPAVQAPQSLPAAPAIVNSEPDYFVGALVDVPPSDPLYSQQWDLPVVGAPDAWQILPSDAPKVTIAVIDSGICADHPELQGRVLPGWDFVENDAVPQDEYGHGCGVAGIIAANINDGAGIAGIAPNAMILPLRVLDAKGVGTYSNVAAAIVRAADEGAQVINLSVGGSNPSSVLENAINYAISKRVTVVAAAGNTGSNVLYPAAYAPVISVGSVDANLQRSSFSSYLPQLDTLAPGSNILTTALNQSYKTVSGTSFASAEVSATVALDLGAGYPLVFDGSVFTFGPREANGVQPTPTSPTLLTDSTDGEVQPLAVIGPDSRVRVTDTTVTPNSAVVLIYFDSGLSTYICSGSIIAPLYVLTAGHCAYDGGVYSTNIYIYPGNNGASEPFGFRTATIAYVPPIWISSAAAGFGGSEKGYDWALLKLNSAVPASIQPFALSSYSDTFFNSSTILTNAGYPGDKCRYSGEIVTYCPPVGADNYISNGDTQWTSSGFATVFSENPLLLESKIDTFGGQSGSSLYYTDLNQPAASRYVITGVLSHASYPNNYFGACYRTPGEQCANQGFANYFKRVTTDLLEALVVTNDVPFVNPSCYAINIAVTGSGTVSRSLPRSVGAGCATGTYTMGSSFGLSAVASPGWVFSGWSSGTSSNDVNATYTVMGAATVTATFVPQPPPAPSTVLPIGFYDDRDPNISYSVGWTQFSGTGPSDNTLAFTSVQNAIATFAFNGTGIILYRSLANNRGPMEVCVDTSCQTITSYNPTVVWAAPTATIDSGSVATRVVRIRNLTGGFIDLDAVQVLGPPTPLGIGTYQENNGNLTYSGNWTANSTSSALGGSRKYTKDQVGKVSFDVTSAVGRIVIYRTTYLTGVYGSLQVYVDGALQTSIDNTSSDFLFGMPFVFSVTPTGHNIELRNVGSTYSDLDQITLLAPATPLTVGSYQESDANLIYGGLWTASSTASALGGARKYTNDPNGTVTFNIDNTVGRITLYRTTYAAGVYGSLQVFVDGIATPLTTINNTSSAFLYQQPFTFAVTPGNHSITFKNVGSTYSDIDQITLQSPPAALGVGTYQETDANLVYSGTWTDNTTASALGGSRKFTNDANGSVSFNINNTVGRITLYRTTYAAGVYGSFQLYVDGALVTTINNTSSAFLFQQPFTFEVTPGSHTITFKNVGTTYSDIDQITLQAATAPLAVGSYQETEPNLIYNGVWVDNSAASALDGARKYTSDPNATVSFKVDNSVGRVMIYRTTYAAGVYGSFQLYVDGALVTTINNTSSAFLFQQPFSFTVAPGSHTILLKNVGSTYSDLDQITLQAPPSPLGVGTYQETDANLAYAGVWTANSTASALGGARSFTNDPNGTVTFSINNMVGRVTIYRTTYAAGVYGAMQVFLDGAATPFMTINNTSSAFLFQQPFTFAVIPGSHTITFKNVGTTYSDLDQITLEAATTPLTIGSYQETEPGLIYNGAWTANSTASALGGGRKYTNDPYGSVSFSIDNTVGQVTIYRTTYATGVYGSFQVFVDNSPVALTTINNTSSAFLFQQPFTFAVTPGSHIITLKNVGSTYSDIDQITLLAQGAQSQPLLPTATTTLTPIVVTATSTLTPTATVTALASPTPVETATSTLEPTQTPAPTETVVPTDTPAPTATLVPTNTPLPTEVPTSTPLPTVVPTNTPVPTEIPTNTPLPTDVPTETPSGG